VWLRLFVVGARKASLSAIAAATGAGGSVPCWSAGGYRRIVASSVMALTAS